MNKMTITPLLSKQDVLQKLPKQRDLSKSNKTGKTNLCMESTHCEVQTLIETKETLVSGYAVQV